MEFTIVHGNTAEGGTLDINKAITYLVQWPCPVPGDLHVDVGKKLGLVQVPITEKT